MRFTDLIAYQALLEPGKPAIVLKDALRELLR